MRVCLGGTFHPFHAGHEALLEAAAKDATQVFVGITDGAMARRARPVPPWTQRAERVQRYWEEAGHQAVLITNALTDPVGPAASKPYDAIVASPETLRGAQSINAQRAESGLPPLQIRRVPHVLGEDLLPLSATRIHAGDIDRQGRRLTPVRIVVGSANPVKVAGAREGVERMLPGLDLDVDCVPVASGVPEQPQEADTLLGAEQRARAALEARPDADYAIGVEAGLNREPDGARWFDVQACVVLDGSGHATQGWGPAFEYPSWVTERALAGEMVSEILGPVAEDPRIGGTTGAIGFLTDGRYDRTEFTQQAVLMAFVPRVRRALYAFQPEP